MATLKWNTSVACCNDKVVMGKKNTYYGSIRKFSTATCWSGGSLFVKRGKTSSLGVVRKTVQSQTEPLKDWKGTESEMTSSLCDLMTLSVQAVNYRKPPPLPPVGPVLPKSWGKRQRTDSALGPGVPAVSAEQSWALLGWDQGLPSPMDPTKSLEGWLPQALPRRGAHNSSLSKSLPSLPS